MTVQLQSGTPLAEQLSAAVQQKIVEIGWSSDGEDASPLSEYIVLMLVNGKTESQITSELSGDLLGLGPEDESVKLFIAWMFSELERLAREMGVTNGGSAEGPPTGPAADGEAPDATNRPDEDMAEDGHDGSGLDGIPTGPKAMRGQKQRRPGGLYNQIQKNMDRTGDPLRRLNNNRGNDQSRIQKHDPSRGPRQNFNGPHGQMNRHMGRGQQQPHMQSTYMNAAMNPQMGGQGQFGPMMMSPEQQFQFLQMMEQQARMMGMLPQNSGFMGGPGMPGQEQPQQQQGRSLFDRVENGPKAGQNNHHSKPRQHAGGDTEMGDGTGEGAGEDGANQDEIACKFGLRCTKADCPFAHQSPASDPNRPVAFVAGEKCAFGINCKNKKCTQSHPSPASGGMQAKPTYEQQDCKFWPNCKNPHCPFKHPTSSAMPPCRFGSACTKPNCAFSHNPQIIDVPCKFKPCLNPHCSFKHEDGQQQGIFENKTWTPAGGKPHVSDRKFVTDDEGDEELIIPGQEPSSSAAPSSQPIAAGGEVSADL
ncbi:hypothetical protein H072_1962 [Dactylellina haptotyla CBS 200.50]|uniref:C3H1-type domain-containing protein n=1 Tax=Dactylellina haptotyla (strain CBS 200.50) TaxID=1284197 RepID=S8BX70_DACHA|nr:hypothetical protein H072_1962 [Dactylellina haptotyla CBS 200.50]